jgi:hypothetical protein
MLNTKFNSLTFASVHLIDSSISPYSTTAAFPRPLTFPLSGYHFFAAFVPRSSECMSTSVQPMNSLVCE